MIRPGVPALILAPMEGVTDAPMREFLTERGGFSFCVAEFLRVSQTVPPYKVFNAHVPELARDAKTASGVPVQVQLLGGDPERLAESAWRAWQLGARAIDLNFGCPAPTVNRHDGGATLLKFPHRIRAIVEAVRKALPQEIAVSAKLRLGWDSLDPIHLNAEMAAQGGASWITIHGRTRAQGYCPPVYWKPMREVRERIGIPVVANGDIWTLDDFKRCRDESGAEHFMLGRGALADPELVTQVARELASFPLAESARVNSALPRRWIPLFIRFSEICFAYSFSDVMIARRVKQWLQIVRRRFDLPWFDEIKRFSSFSQILHELEARN